MGSNHPGEIDALLRVPNPPEPGNPSATWLVVPAVSSLLGMVNRNPPVPLSCEAAVYCPRRLMQAAAAAHLQVGVGTREAWHFFMLVLDCLELEVQSLCKADLVQCR